MTEKATETTDKDQPVDTPTSYEDELIQFRLPLIKKEISLTKRRRGLIVKIIPFVSALLALIAGGFLIFLFGVNPISAYQAILYGAFGSPRRLGQTIVIATPLIIGGIAVSVAFKTRMWNIGGVGQYLIGALGATIIAGYIPGAITTPISNQNEGIIPLFLHLPLMLIVAMAAGAIIGLIPAILKTEFNMNEVVSTVMINYIVTSFVLFTLRLPLSDPRRGDPISVIFPSSARLPTPFTALGINMDVGILLALVVAPLLWFLLYKTRLGYQMRITGSAPKASRACGLETRKAVWSAMLISGALFGLAGFVHMSGVWGYFDIYFVDDTGYASIPVGILAYFNPILCLLTGFFFGILKIGAVRLSYVFQIPQSLSAVIQGLIMIFLLVGEFIRRRLEDIE